VWGLVVASSMLVLTKKKEHFHVGVGTATPRQAVDRFLSGFLEQEYADFREVLFFDRPNCGAFGLIALDPSNIDDVSLFFSEHWNDSDNSIINKSSSLFQGKEFYPTFHEHWLERVNPHWQSLYVYADAIKQSQIIVSGNRAVLRFPRRKIDGSGKFIGLDLEKVNSIQLIQVRSRWYIFNPTCHIYGVVLPRSQTRGHEGKGF